MKSLTIGALLASAMLILPATAIARPWWMRGVESNDNDFLPPDVAFRVSSRIDGSLLRVRWIIADGYYLYRARMQITAESPDLKVSAPSFPPGIAKTDPYLGTQQIFVQQVEGAVTFIRSDFGAHPLEIKVSYQGCAEAGLCYPPITKVLLPASAPAILRPQPQPWEGVAIIGGMAAFLIAGLLLRKGRRLDSPAS
jgi:thiol:disulfide interchange protein